MANPATDPALSLLPPMPTAPQYGRFVHHEMLDPRKHGPGLWEALGGARMNDMTRWLFWPRIDSREQFIGHLNQFIKMGATRSLRDRLLRRPIVSNAYAILDAATGEVMGMRCYTDPSPRHAYVESGPVINGPRMASSALSTESSYLCAHRAFEEWGCRRYVARCIGGNTAAHNMILRAGFTSEGVSRNHRIYGGKSHDTLWFSMTPEEWPPVKQAFEIFLSEDNLGPDLKAKRRLKDIRDELLANAQAGHDRA